MVDDSEGSSDVSEDPDDLLKDLLGGITFDVPWIEEPSGNTVDGNWIPGKVPTHENAGACHVQEISREKNRSSKLSTTSQRTAPIQFSLQIGDQSSAGVFKYAYRCSGYCSLNGKVERPPLQVVDLEQEGRGNGLMVTQPIPRGSVIYTERAAVATQVPPLQVQACQYCFRSLESIERLSKCLPHPELWPVPRLEFSSETFPAGQDDEEVDEVGSLQTDKLGRICCVSCKSLFCTRFHYNEFWKEFGSCCRMVEAQQAVESFDGGVIQAPVALAARLWVHAVEHNRRDSRKSHFLEGFCGQAGDLTALELGVQEGVEGRYTLQPLYDRLSDILNLSSREKEEFSLNNFHNMASQSGRNGFGLLTQSPFKGYYSALLRKSMDRNSEEHQQNMKHVAQALAGKDQLERGMDRLIEARVAPEIVAVFPLTARCNHSCQPNAQVKSQEFVDAHIDLVALRDLTVGDELLISYIPVGEGVGRRSTAQRRRELQAKYLFYCDCERCRTGS